MNYVKSCLIITMLIGIGFADASISIENVNHINQSDGTFDIYMTNDETVGTVSFYLSGMTITNLTDGDMVNGIDGFDLIYDESNRIYFSVIFPGMGFLAGQGVLATVTFTGYNNENICFMEDLTCYIDGEIDYSLSGEFNYQTDCELAGGIFSYRFVGFYESMLPDGNIIIDTGWGDCHICDDGGCETLCAPGDMNGDDNYNVLDIVTLANCVLANNCNNIENGCAGDINGDDNYNVLDIVILANCVLANNCGD